MLSREAILGADDLKRQEVEVPEWGGSIYVRSLTGSELLKLDAIVSGEEYSFAQVVALCAVDGTGAPLFTEEDIPALEQKNGKVLVRIASAALRFNSMTADALTEGKGD